MICACLTGVLWPWMRAPIRLRTHRVAVSAKGRLKTCRGSGVERPRAPGCCACLASVPIAGPAWRDALTATFATAARWLDAAPAVVALSSGVVCGAWLLRVFDEVAYRRAGLACRLDRNVCHRDGVAERDAGGFFIVQGRGLPRLDVVGHRRLVDWPRLVSQLMAISGSAPSADSGDD